MALLATSQLFNKCAKLDRQSLKLNLSATFTSTVSLAFEQLGGIDALEALQLSKSHRLYELAKNILLKHFEEDFSSLAEFKDLLDF